MYLIKNIMIEYNQVLVKYYQQREMVARGKGRVKQVEVYGVKLEELRSEITKNGYIMTNKEILIGFTL
jgi:hypothetical protein